MTEKPDPAADDQKNCPSCGLHRDQTLWCQHEWHDTHWRLSKAAQAEMDALKARVARLTEALQLAVTLLRREAEPANLGGTRFDLTDCKEMKSIFAAISEANDAG